MEQSLLIAPERARQVKLRNGDMIRLFLGNASVAAPAWIMPGQAADCVVALLGSGRRVGSVGSGAGFDFYPLTGRADAPSLEKIKQRADLACTDHHNLIFDEAGEYVRHGTLAQYGNDPQFLATGEPEPHLYRWKPEGPAAWGMSVDLNACIGCNACVVACQAENNIPIVGKEQVIREREMHWLRIDRYYEGAPEAPDSYFQPILCMHCEQAPCEVVCPVGATVHDVEGLNVMVYNRCIGTRFCSNNCPYKVRRFNYFAFAQEEHRPPESRNPDVTVRGRGVMEKCTFCLQRIADARIAADRSGRCGLRVKRRVPRRPLPSAIWRTRTARSPNAKRARSIMRCWRTKTRIRASPTRRASATRIRPLRAAADDRYSSLPRIAFRESRRPFATAAC
jgi:Fe-S-cluster-containing dehydrogenase component